MSNAIIAEAYKLALALIQKLVEKARGTIGDDIDWMALLSGIEDVLDVIRSDHQMDPEMAKHVLADLKRFDEALSGNDDAADRALRDKFGDVDPDPDPS